MIPAEISGRSGGVTLPGKVFKQTRDLTLCVARARSASLSSWSGIQSLCGMMACRKNNESRL
jgi:hypothetical protein